MPDDGGRAVFWRFAPISRDRPAEEDQRGPHPDERPSDRRRDRVDGHGGALPRPPQHLRTDQGFRHIDLFSALPPF